MKSIDGDKITPLIILASYSKHISMTTLLAWRNLAHDRSRLLVAIAGIGFSVLLMSIQVSLMLGFTKTAAGLVDHAGADLWVCGAGIKNVDQMPVIPRSWKYSVLSVPGISAAEPYLVRFSVLRAPDGRTESVVVVGFDTASGLGSPWNLVAGDTRRLEQSGILVDELYKSKLGIDTLDQRVEVGGVRGHVIGFTRGIRTFVQSPYVFTSFRNSQLMSNLTSDEATCILGRFRAGADPAQIVAEVRSRLPYSDTYLAPEFARVTVRYWLFSTGIGFYLILGCAMGLIVGAVIAAQTLYASASDYLPEYATMRAIGASNPYMRSVVLQQAAISGTLGYLTGAGTAAAIAGLIGDGAVALVFPWWAFLSVGAVTIAMCMVAGLIAIRRVLLASPVSVFR